MTKVVLEEEVRNSLYSSMNDIFENFGGSKELFKNKNVFIKINAIDFRKQCYTSPKVIASAIDVVKDSGANEVNIIENVTQSNVTRVVFNVIGLDNMFGKKDAKPIYLDEEDSIEVKIGEDNKEIEFPKILYQKLIKNKDDNFYLSLPKLKTHSMTTVTLGVKSQMGLIQHVSRPTWHNFELHQFLTDLYDFVKPDFTIIDGLNAIIHGHYPLENKLDEYVEPMNILIGGKDTLAVDTIAAKVLGYDIDEVKHLKLAKKANLGYGNLEKINLKGNISKFQEKYPYTIIGDYPDNVKIIEGKEKACPEGCKNNTLMVLEMLHVDYGADGPFNIIFGKGFNKKELKNLKDGPILIVGPCAIGEVGGFLENEYPDKEIVTVDAHNDLAGVTSALLSFTGVKTTDILPLSFGTLLAYLKARIHGSSAITPSLF